MLAFLKSYLDLGFTESNVVSRPPEEEKNTAKAQQPVQMHGFAAGGLALAGGTASWASGLVALLAFAVALLALVALMAFLRKRQNPTYWQVSCWLLVAAGILVRQLFLPSNQLDLSGFTLSLALSSGFVSLAVLPFLMCWLNKVKPGPNIEQVAVPFALGFFLDYGQVLVSTYALKLPWV
jgi:hypothetical protein